MSAICKAQLLVSNNLSRNQIIKFSVSLKASIEEEKNRSKKLSKKFPKKQKSKIYSIYLSWRRADLASQPIHI